MESCGSSTLQLSMAGVATSSVMVQFRHGAGQLASWLMVGIREFATECDRRCGAWACSRFAVNSRTAESHRRRILLVVRKLMSGPDLDSKEIVSGLHRAGPVGLWSALVGMIVRKSLDRYVVGNARIDRNASLRGRVR